MLHKARWLIAAMYAWLMSLEEKVWQCSYPPVKPPICRSSELRKYCSHSAASFSTCASNGPEWRRQQARKTNLNTFTHLKSAVQNLPHLEERYSTHITPCGPRDYVGKLPSETSTTDAVDYDEMEAVDRLRHGRTSCGRDP